MAKNLFDFYSIRENYKTERYELTKFVMCEFSKLTRFFEDQTTTNENGLFTQFYLVISSNNLSFIADIPKNIFLQILENLSFVNVGEFFVVQKCLTRPSDNFPFSHTSCLCLAKTTQRYGLKSKVINYQPFCQEQNLVNLNKNLSVRLSLCFYFTF